MAFSKLGLSPTIVDGVKAMGYVEPTPIQLRAIPLVLAGRDVIGSAQTGTGKTAAFALPILSQLGQHIARTARAHPRTHARTRRAGGNRHPRLRALHQFANHRRFWRRRLWPAERRIARRHRHRRRHARTFAGSSRTRHRAAGQGAIPRARRGRPDAGHGISARRAPHPGPLSAPAPHRAVFRDHSAADRNAHPMGDAQSRNDSKSARAGRPPKPSSTSFIPFPIRRNPTCCCNCSRA